MRIEDATFVITDTETTGLRADSDRLIEIAAVKLRGGEVIGRFEQLINPGRHIPANITRLTGISTGMVLGKPAVDLVLQDFVDFLGDGVLVAHNLRFDWGFLQSELSRSGLPALEVASLCTVRLARRILPALPSKGLGALTRHFKIQNHARHRAMGDAEATAQVFLRLLSYVTFDQGMEDLDDLLQYQFKTYGKVRSESIHVRKLRDFVTENVPSSTGIYRMFDRRGKLLYVGKAKNLNARVSSYFRAVASHPEKTQSLVRQVREITWQETGTELEALLLESRLIKEQLPPFNRAGKQYRNLPFIRLAVDKPFPTITWTKVILDDDAEYYGPLPNKETAIAAVELVQRMYRLRECDDHRLHERKSCIYLDMKRCLGPCINERVRYSDEVEKVRNFLSGHDKDVLSRMEDRMFQLAEERNYEEAAWFRDQHRIFSRLLDGEQSIAEPVRMQNGIVFALEDGAWEVHSVLFGRPCRSERIFFDANDGESDRKLLSVAETFLDDFFAAKPPERYSPQDVDAIRVLAGWLFTNREKVLPVMYRQGESMNEFSERIMLSLREWTDVVS